MCMVCVQRFLLIMVREMSWREVRRMRGLREQGGKVRKEIVNEVREIDCVCVCMTELSG